MMLVVVYFTCGALVGSINVAGDSPNVDRLDF